MHAEENFQLGSGLDQRDRARSRIRYVGNFAGARSKTATANGDLRCSSILRKKINKTTSNDPFSNSSDWGVRITTENPRVRKSGANDGVVRSDDDGDDGDDGLHRL